MLKNLDKVVKDMVENGTPANQVLEMPFYYILQILDERHLNTVDTDEKRCAILCIVALVIGTKAIFISK